MKPRRMQRIHYLAAEVFNYSYANYQNHLGVNARFDKYMPEDVKKLEAALDQGWCREQVAGALEVSTEEADLYLEAMTHARKIVDARDLSEGFSHAVRRAVCYALENGLSADDPKSIDALVKQVCYRVSDLSMRLEDMDRPLAWYSRHLRRSPDVEYPDGYFDEGGH